MKIIRKSETESFTNGPTCTGYGPSFGDKDLDIAVVTVNGRYPEEGYVLNEVCKEIAYVLNGSGRLVMGNEEIQDVEIGDTVMIQPGEKYYWEGENLEMIMPCSPAFYPAQHKSTT
jgi:mannose-6-phosphate isomerase-like protein (cupin superfamily)